MDNEDNNRGMLASLPTSVLIRSVALTGIFIMMLIFCLHTASDILIPMTIAYTLNLLYSIRVYINLFVSIFFLFVNSAFAQSETLEACLARLVVAAPVDATVGDLRNQCGELIDPFADEVDTATEERLINERAVATNEYSLLQHRDNYLLPIAYNFKSDAIDALTIPGDARELDPTEFKFQLSFKTLMFDQPFNTRTRLYAAYTNTSWWQAYNKDESSPFRETNHQPEIFLEVDNDLTFGDWELASMRFGINHVSNGRSGDFSRTWNRVIAEFAISDERNEIRLSPWVTLSDVEDNPDIEDYRGRFELAGTHLRGEHTFNWKARHTLDSNSRGAIEIDWSFPVRGRDDAQFFLQYFDGYGESLIDYNLKIRRIGIGFRLGS